MSFLFRRARQLTPASGKEAVARRRLLCRSTFEIVPMGGVDTAIADLPSQASVAVTCSPVRGIDATLQLAESLAAAGHRPIPHLAARMVESEAHLDRTIAMLEAIGIDEVFVIAGDAAEAHGPYADSLGVIAELLERAPFLETIGVTGYPDGHPYIDSDALRAALHTKQQMFAAAGVQGYVATQMCFDPDTILTWLRSERAAGMTMPVQLGVAGVVDRAKLLTLGVRLGVGTSLRYLSKNRNAIGRLLSPGGYRPDQLLADIESEAEELGITGLHLFTFNQVGTTAEWYDRALAQVRPTL